MAGVIPVIFASSLLAHTAARGVADGQPGRAGRNGSSAISRPAASPLYLVVYFLLIIFFAYFYVAITFNPVDVADDMKKYGGFIPGIRPGRPTASTSTTC